MMRINRIAPPFLLFILATITWSSPVPFVNNPLVPTSVAPGSGAFTLTVNGGGFVNGSTIDWNGAPLATTFVSNAKLTAAVPAADTQNAGSAEITVTNPGTGTASNMVQFLVAAPGSNVFYQNAPNSPYGNYLSPSGFWDLTGAGKLDLLTFSWVPQYDGIMHDNGNGILTPSQPTNALQWGYWAWIVGDFNADGKLDVLGTNSDTASWPPSGTFQLFWGQGNGTFSAGSTVAIPAGFFVIAQPLSNGAAGAITYDFNGDGNLDLLAENFTANPRILEVLLGSGDGTFTAGPATTLPSGYGLSAIGDFNGDGKPDLLLAASGSDAEAQSVSFKVLLGNGDGTFTPESGPPITVSPADVHVAVADLNGDGKLDLAVPDGVNGAPTNSGGVDSPPIAILLGNGDGTFTRVANCCGNPGLQAYNVVAADLNNDGKLDLAVSIANNPGSFQASLEGAPPVYIEAFLGNGDGTFQPANYSMLLPSDPGLSGGDGTMGLYAADLNGDGKLDFVTGDIFNYGAAGYEISVLAQTAPPAQLPDFTIAAANSTVSVKAGATATDGIQITSVNGFLGSGVSLAVAGCPATVTCSITQPQGTIIPSSTGSFPLTIATQACTVTGASAPPPLFPIQRWPPLIWFGLVGTAAILGRRLNALDHCGRLPLLQRHLVWTAMVLACVAIAACNTGSTQDKTPACTGGTPVGGYTIGVTATSVDTTHATSIAIVVQ